MKKWILVFLLINHYALIAQIENDSTDIAISLTNYSFYYNTKLNNGTTSLGTTFHINTNGKLTIQLGFLYDFKKYIFYEKRIDYNNGTFYYDPVEHINLFFPLFLNYNYLTSEKVKLFLVSGVIFGGQNSMNENNRAFKLSNLNIIGGAGISYQLFKFLSIRSYPSIRYNSHIFFPGISFDLSFPFNSKKCLL